eukprot:jgi/Mesvir1/14721/Mv05369-RA.2
MASEMQAQPQRKPLRPASASECTFQEIVGEEALEGQRMSAGALLELMDMCAGRVAWVHAGGPVVTASFDRVDMLTPILHGDFLRVHGAVVAVGSSSISVHLCVFRHDRYVRQFVGPIIVSMCTMVAVDAAGKPNKSIPGLLPAEEAEEGAVGGGEGPAVGKGDGKHGEGHGAGHGERRGDAAVAPTRAGKTPAEGDAVVGNGVGEGGDAKEPRDRPAKRMRPGAQGHDDAGGYWATGTPGLPTGRSSCCHARELASDLEERKRLREEWDRIQREVDRDPTPLRVEDLTAGTPPHAGHRGPPAAAPHGHRLLLSMADSVVCSRRHFMPRHLNVHRTLFGGELIHAMDRLAHYCARNFAGNKWVLCLGRDGVVRLSIAIPTAHFAFLGFSIMRLVWATPGFQLVAIPPMWH